MIPEKDLQELDQMLDEDLCSKPPRPDSGVYCHFCHKLISSSGDGQVREAICSACSKQGKTGHKGLGYHEQALSENRLSASRVESLRGFDNLLSRILKGLDDLSRLREDDTEFELSATAIWKNILDLSVYANCSEQHNELVATLHQVTASESRQEFTQAKALALGNALGILKGKVIFSDSDLDEVCDALQKEHFDINYSMGFVKE